MNKMFNVSIPRSYGHFFWELPKTQNDDQKLPPKTRIETSDRMYFDNSQQKNIEHEIPRRRSEIGTALKKSAKAA